MKTPKSFEKRVNAEIKKALITARKHDELMEMLRKENVSIIKPCTFPYCSCEITCFKDD